MERWDRRTQEVAFLLNPAFCGRIIYTVVKTYNEKTQHPLAFPLIYLILPLVLHKETRDTINSRTQLLIWAQEHSSLLIDFSKRARDLVPITNEAVEFLLQSGKLQLTLTGELEFAKQQKVLSGTKFVDDEVATCLKKSEHIAKWFAKAGKVETIYICLGVRP